MDNIYYLFDWGDESNSGWIGPFESGEICNTTNIWDSNGDFEIKVKAKDVNGLESGWSDPLIILMSKTNNRFLDLLIQFLDNHPIISLILQFFNLN